MKNCYYCTTEEATIFKKTKKIFNIGRDQSTNDAQFCSEKCAEQWKDYGHEWENE